MVRPLIQNTTTHKQSGNQATVVDSEVLKVVCAIKANSIGVQVAQFPLVREPSIDFSSGTKGAMPLQLDQKNPAQRQPLSRSVLRVSLHQHQRTQLQEDSRVSQQLTIRVHRLRNHPWLRAPDPSLGRSAEGPARRSRSCGELKPQSVEKSMFRGPKSPKRSQAFKAQQPQPWLFLLARRVNQQHSGAFPQKIRQPARHRRNGLENRKLQKNQERVLRPLRMLRRVPWVGRMRYSLVQGRHRRASHTDFRKQAY